MDTGDSRTRKKTAGKTRGQTGRVTTPSSSNDHKPAQSARYTPPTHEVYVESPRWLLILMATLFALGFLVLILNYAGALPKLPLIGEPGGAGYLVLGLAFLTGGFVAASQYR